MKFINYLIITIIKIKLINSIGTEEINLIKCLENNSIMTCLIFIFINYNQEKIPINKNGKV